jgi:hypothetical protein
LFNSSSSSSSSSSKNNPNNDDDGHRSSDSEDAINKKYYGQPSDKEFVSTTGDSDSDSSDSSREEVAPLKRKFSHFTTGAAINYMGDAVIPNGKEIDPGIFHWAATQGTGRGPGSRSQYLKEFTILSHEQCTLVLYDQQCTNQVSFKTTLSISYLLNFLVYFVH